jgi:hypothetical protein
VQPQPQHHQRQALKGVWPRTPAQVLILHAWQGCACSQNKEEIVLRVPLIPKRL